MILCIKEMSYRRKNTFYYEGLKAIERRTLMKFNAFEIDPIIDNYMHKKDDLVSRLNIIHSTRFSDSYDDDLRDEQVRRINAKIDEIEERIKELEEFKKEL